MTSPVSVHRSTPTRAFRLQAVSRNAFRDRTKVVDTERLGSEGKYIHFELLGHRHIERTAAASAGDPSSYQRSPVPQGKNQVMRYAETDWKDAGTAVTWTVDEGDAEVDNLSLIVLRCRGSEPYEFYRNHELALRQNFWCFILYG